MERMEINLSIMTKDQLKKFIVELEEENRKLKDKIEHLEFDINAWKQLKLVMEGKIEKLKAELELKNLALKQIQEGSILI